MIHSVAPLVSSPTHSDLPAPLPVREVRSETTEGFRAALRERYRLDRVPDDALHAGVKTHVGRHNALTADLLAHLAEVDARGIYRERACSSLYTYCVYELRFSEDEAQRRVQAARTARQFPVLFEMLAEGAIHMTGLLLLAPHLTGENCAELLARARFRTKREIERLVAEVAPRADVPARIEPLGPCPKTVTNLWQAFTASLRGRMRELEPGTASGQAPAPVFELSGQGAISELDEIAGRDATAETPAPARHDTPHATDSDPVVPLRYRIEFTVGQEYVDRLEEARNLLQHQVPNRDVARIHELSMAMFVEHLRKRRKAASRPQRRIESERVMAAEDGNEQLGADGTSHPSEADGSAPERVSQQSRAYGSAPEGVNQLSEVDGSAPERVGQQSRADGSAPDGISETSVIKRPATTVVTEPSAIEPPATTPGTEAPAPKRSAPARIVPNSRHIPAAIRRVVWARDGGTCTFSDANGRRCRERSGLEIHHEHAFALGGPTTAENLRLLCRAHNALFAERDFGPAHIERMRTGRRPT